MMTLSLVVGIVEGLTLLAKNSGGVQSVVHQFVCAVAMMVVLTPILCTASRK